MNTFVATIDLTLAPKLQEGLEAQGFTLTKPPYTLFSGSKNGVSCTLYASGKLTVQGKGKDEFIINYLEPEILQNFTFSYPETEVDMTPHIGVDEAGKGDFFGPLCVGAVFADEKGIKTLLQLGVKDSKQMSDKTMLLLAPKIKAAVPTALVVISPKKYNEMYKSFQNLNRLLAWGHATAIEELLQKTGPQKILVDQFSSQPLVQSALRSKGILMEVNQRPRAEEDPVVAAASIMARATFVKKIEDLSKQVGIDLPKGAASQVIVAGRRLVARDGEQALEHVAKLHFKTTQQVLSI